MTEEIQDFETENLIGTFKFKLTDWTLSQYSSMTDILNSQRRCLKAKCLGTKSNGKSFEEFQSCIRNCETGMSEILTM